jgi:hypothetical protein
MVKDDWNIVQCTNCNKINRIPGTEKREPVKMNDNTNHFDLYLPYVVSNILSKINTSFYSKVHCY